MRPVFIHSKKFPLPNYSFGYTARPFKPRGLPPVRGGRINIRKRLDGRWSVWSNGAKKKNTRTFDTWAEAYHWGCVTLKCYYSFRRAEAELVLKALRKGQVPDTWLP